MATRKKTAASSKKKSSPKKVIEHDPLSLPDEEPETEQVKAETQSDEGENKTKKESTATESNDIIDLGDSLIISEVESCRNILLDALQGGKDLILDGSEIEQIDGAGLQLLAAVALDAEKMSVTLKWHGASQVLCEASGKLGLIDVMQLNEICQAA